MKENGLPEEQPQEELVTLEMGHSGVSRYAVNEALCGRSGGARVFRVGIHMCCEVDLGFFFVVLASVICGADRGKFRFSQLPVGSWCWWRFFSLPSHLVEAGWYVETRPSFGFVFDLGLRGYT